MASVTSWFDSSPERQRTINLEKANVPYEPFYGNKGVRVTYNVFTYLILIFGIIGLICGVGVIGRLFWNKNPREIAENLGAATTDADEGTKDAADVRYRDMRATLLTAITCCAFIGVLLLILIVLYFFFLEQDLLFSERMSINLATMTQGPDRIRRVAGLLSTYVYPQQTAGSDTARNNLANDLLQNLRKSYYAYTGFEPKNEAEYQQLVRSLGTVRSGDDRGFVNPVNQISPQEYNVIKQEAVNRYNSPLEQQEFIEDAVNDMETRLKERNDPENYPYMPNMTPQEREAHLYTTILGKPELAPSYLESQARAQQEAQQAEQEAQQQAEQEQLRQQMITNKDNAIAERNAAIAERRRIEQANLDARTRLATIEAQKNAIVGKSNYSPEDQAKVNAAYSEAQQQLERAMEARQRNDQRIRAAEMNLGTNNVTLTPDEIAQRQATGMGLNGDFQVQARFPDFTDLTPTATASEPVAGIKPIEPVPKAKPSGFAFGGAPKTFGSK